MTDTITIIRVTGRTFNETTGAYTNTTTTVYSGKCRVKPHLSDTARQVEAGEQAVYLWPFTVTLPMTATGVEVGDVGTVGASLDPDLPGQELVVKDVIKGSQITGRRLGCVAQEA